MINAYTITYTVIDDVDGTVLSTGNTVTVFASSTVKAVAALDAMAALVPGVTYRETQVDILTGAEVADLF